MCSWHYTENHRAIRSRFHKTCEDRQEWNKFRKEMKCVISGFEQTGRRGGCRSFFHTFVCAPAPHLNSMCIAFITRRDRHFSLTQGSCLWLARESRGPGIVPLGHRQSRFPLLPPGALGRRPPPRPLLCKHFNPGPLPRQPYLSPSFTQLCVNTNHFSLRLFTILFFQNRAWDAFSFWYLAMMYSILWW